SEAALLVRARASYASLSTEARGKKTRLDVRLFGAAGTPLKGIFSADGESVTVRSEITLSPATKRALDATSLREQLGRLGDTPFARTAIDTTALATGLFLPVSEQNHQRQQATEQLMLRRDWAHEAKLAARRAQIEAAIACHPERPKGVEGPGTPSRKLFALAASVYTIDDADAAAAAGATEIIFDPFLRHPAPPRARVRALKDRLDARSVGLRL